MTDQLDTTDLADFADLADLADLAPVPRRRPGTLGRPRPVFLSLQAATNRLSRRFQQLLDDAGAALSPTEAAALVAIMRDPGAAIALSRREAGLQPSTMTSVLDRLERRGFIRRQAGNEDHRFVAVWPTLQGRIASDQARAALAELDEELGVYVHPDDLAAIEAVAEASAAIGTLGTLPDY
jgi:DNA-binding MarR family transcriptional regulator